MEPQTASTPALAREAIEDLGKLVREEIALARDELRRDLGATSRPLLAAAGGVLFAWIGTQLWLDANAVLQPRRARVVGAVLSVLGLGALVAGWALTPKQPLQRTRRRLRTEEKLVREQLQR